MKEPKYFICVKDGSIYAIIKHVKDNYYLWPYNNTRTGVVPREDGRGKLANALKNILFNYVVVTAVSKNQALSFATRTYLSKHYPEHLI